MFAFDSMNMYDYNDYYNSGYDPVMGKIEILIIRLPLWMWEHGMRIKYWYIIFFKRKDVELMDSIIFKVRK
jgi:hypothetical protein